MIHTKDKETYVPSVRQETLTVSSTMLVSSSSPLPPSVLPPHGIDEIEPLHYGECVTAKSSHPPLSGKTKFRQTGASAKKRSPNSMIAMMVQFFVGSGYVKVENGSVASFALKER